MYARAVRGSTITLRSDVFVDSNENASNCDLTPTCVVTRYNGTALTVTGPTVVANDAGKYTATVTAPSTVDRLTVVWTGMVNGVVQILTDTVDVVGAHYVSIPTLREFLPGVDVALLRRLRDSFAQKAERYTGRAFTPCYWRDRLDGEGSFSLQLTRDRPTSVIAVSVNGTSQDPTAFVVYDWSVIEAKAIVFISPTPSIGGRNCVIDYQYGEDAPDGDIEQASIDFVRRRAAQSSAALTNDAIRESAGDGHTIQFSTPDFKAGRPTGILTVDAVLNDLARGGHRSRFGIA